LLFASVILLGFLTLCIVCGFEFLIHILLVSRILKDMLILHVASDNYLSFIIIVNGSDYSLLCLCNLIRISLNI